MTNTLVQVRIDNKLKTQASKVFEDVGLDLSTAIKIFLKRSVQKKGIPFSMNQEDMEYQSALENIMSMRSDIAKAGAADMTLEEINAEINSYRSNGK